MTEIENIRKIADHKRITSVVISGTEATEESIKNLYRKSSPDVIHIATHGFSSLMSVRITIKPD